MEVNLKKMGDILSIELKGRMDTSIPEEFETQLLNLINNGETHLVFDFSQVEYITTNGLRVLMNIYKAVSKVNGKMIFHTLNERVKRIFEIAGLTTVFQIFESREESFASFETRSDVSDHSKH